MERCWIRKITSDHPVSGFLFFYDKAVISVFSSSMQIFTNEFCACWCVGLIQIIYSLAKCLGQEQICSQAALHTELITANGEDLFRN